MQPVARIRLFGRFDLRVDEVAVALDSARAESLLAYLLLHPGDPHPRQGLAFLLWPDSREAQARTNLRSVLHVLRHRMPEVDRYLEITHHTVRWRSEAPFWLDVATFERSLAADDGDGRQEALRAAVGVYVGELLERCADGWLLEERERLRYRQLDALAELTALCEARGETAEAITHAERLLRGDPLREQTYRQLMRLHDARGELGRALRVYHVCSSTLERELGIEPAPETRATYEGLLPGGHDDPPVAAAHAGGPPLVGRAAERARLVAAWKATDAGTAQFLLVSGEPGVGKSRLVEEFRAWCARRGAAVAEARCYPAEGPLAYEPVAAWLRSEALRPRLDRLDRPRLTELARLLPELLADVPDLERPVPLPESDQRHRLFDAVASAVWSAGGPVLLVVEDVQHGDRETCRLLHYLLRVRPHARLLVVATARREEVDPGHPVHELLAVLRERARFDEIELTRLSRAETALLAERITGSPLAEPAAHRLHAETEGNALFVVEALRAGWATGNALTPRVQAVIESRLDRLGGPVRDLVAVAATVGRAFSADVLAAAADTDEDTVARGLDELWRRRIVREQGSGGFGDAYDFSHDKIREVAYRGIGPARRRRLHQRVAQAMEQLSGADPGPVSAQIAVHHERAGAAGRAVAWYRRAADSARLLHANAEAVRLLDRALQLVAGVAGSAERDALELEVRTAQLAPLVSVEGYLSPGIAASHQRALHLLGVLRAEPAPPLLRSLAMSSLTAADFAAAARFGQRLRTAAERDGDDVLAVEAAYVLGVAAFWQADFEAARRELGLAVERYRPADHHTHVARFGQDPKVACLTRLAHCLWFLGRADEARSAMAGALAWADEIEHPYSRATGSMFGALLALDMGDEPDVRAHTAALAAAGQEARQGRQVATAFGGYVAVLDGYAAGGIAAIRAAVRRSRDGQAAPGEHAMMVRILLAGCVAAGDGPAAVAAADELLTIGGHARVWEPEAARVRAALGPRNG